jgi:hypothetical protein
MKILSGRHSIMTADEEKRYFMPDKSMVLDAVINSEATLGC